MKRFEPLFRWISAIAGILFATGTYYRSKGEALLGVRGIVIQEAGACLFILAFFLSYLDARNNENRYERWVSLAFLVLITLSFAIAFGYS